MRLQWLLLVRSIGLQDEGLPAEGDNAVQMRVVDTSIRYAPTGAKWLCAPYLNPSDTFRDADLVDTWHASYGGGNGRIYVRVQHRALPLVERDVFYLGESLATEQSSDTVRWVDDNTIHVSEVNQDVDVIGVRWRFPDSVVLLYYLTRMLVVTAREAIRIEA